MIKTLLREVKEYKKDSLITPCFMILEVGMEMVLPVLMASIVDDGVKQSNITHIFLMGGLMLLMALVSLFTGTGIDVPIMAVGVTLLYLYQKK